MNTGNTDSDRNPVESTLIDRDVTSLEFPHKIYALGGAGKEIVFHLFDQDWFVTEASRPDGTRTGIDVHVLDTATETKTRDENQAQQINKRTDQIASELRQQDHDLGTVRDIKVDVRLLTENIHNTELADFIGPQTIDQIKRNTNVDQWWLEESHLNDPTSPGDMFDAATGVIRRRALGKALFQKALAEDPTFHEIFDLGGTDDAPEIALFAGLGGGTGSGIAIDIAKHIRRNNRSARITLFATTPTTEEGGNERSNAFAALSELEALALDDDETNPFNDVVILPLNPTNHQGGEVRTKELLELDEALGYAFLTYYNNNDVDHPCQGTTSYAPFVVAVPQVMRFNVEELNKAREMGFELLENKRQLLEHERRLYDRIETFVTEHYPDADPDVLNQSDIDRLISRVRNFRALVTSPVFDQLEYDDAVTTGEEALASILGQEHEEYTEVDIRAAVEEQGIDDVLSAIEFVLEGSTQEPGNLTRFEDIEETALKRTLIEDLHQIQLLYQLLRNRKRIDVDDDAIARLLEALIDPEADKNRIHSRWQGLQGSLEQKEEQRNAVQEELTELEDEIEEAKAEQAEQLNSLYAEWHETVANDLSTVVELSQIDLDAEFQDLERALEQFQADLLSSEDPTEVTIDVSETLNAIEDALSDTTVSFTDEREDIETSVDRLKEARVTWQQIEETESGSEGGFINILGGEDKAEQERDRYQALKSELNSKNVFRVGPLPDNLANQPFKAERTYNPNGEHRVWNRIRRERSRARAAVVTAFEDEVRTIAADESAVADARTDLESVLGDLDAAVDPYDRIKEVVEDTFRQHLDGDVQQLETKRDQKESRLADLKSDIETLHAVKELQAAARTIHEEYREAHAAFNESLEAGRRLVESRPTVGQDLTSNFIHRIEPHHKTSAKNATSLTQSRILEESDDESTIYDVLRKMMTERIVKTKYNGLRHTTLSTDTGTFAGSLSVGVMTEALEESGTLEHMLSTEDLRFLERHAFRTEAEPGYKQWHVKNGGPWDIALTAFIQGVSFLDNLQDVVHSRRSYRDAYTDKQGRVEDTVLRHALGLDQGYYVYRRDILNLETDRHVLVNAQSETEITTRLTEQTCRVDVDTTPESDSDSTDIVETDMGSTGETPPDEHPQTGPGTEPSSETETDGGHDPESESPD